MKKNFYIANLKLLCIKTILFNLSALKADLRLFITNISNYKLLQTKLSIISNY